MQYFFSYILKAYTGNRQEFEKWFEKKVKFVTHQIAHASLGVYGSNFNLRGVIPELARKLKRNKFIEVLHPENSRDFIHVNDVCKLIIKCLRLKKSYIFDVGFGKSIKIKNQTGTGR